MEAKQRFYVEKVKTIKFKDIFKADDLEESNTNEGLPNSKDDNEENLNTENYHRKIFEELQCNFFRPSLNHNNLEIFRQEREKLKAPKTARDAEYDGSCLVLGEQRPEFDFELFYQ